MPHIQGFQYIMDHSILPGGSQSQAKNITANKRRWHKSIDHGNKQTSFFVTVSAVVG